MDTENKIKEIINTIRPYLNFDGGDIEFIKYEDNYVYVKLSGACEHCASIDDTIQSGIFESIKEEVPEVKGVINSDF